VAQRYTYDAAGLVGRVQVTSAHEVLLDRSATRYSYGALRSVTDALNVAPVATKTFMNDDLGRLVKVVPSSDATEGAITYGYDDLDNMTERTGGRAPGISGSYRYERGSAAPRQLTSIVTAAGPAIRVEHDSAGRIRRLGDEMLSYDGF